MSQPLFSLADQVALGDLHVGEEGLAERAFAADQLDRPRLDAGRRHVDQHERDALVLLGRRVGAHQAEAPVGLVGVAGPDLLAVDQPVVALVLAPGLQRREVGAGARLGIALAPADLALDDLRQVLGLLLLVGELQQHRAQHPDAERDQRRAVARRAPAPRTRAWSGESPPPPYWVGQAGAVQPRAATRFIQTICGSSEPANARPPHIASSRPVTGLASSAG